MAGDGGYRRLTFILDVMESLMNTKTKLALALIVTIRTGVV
jgi:hypothetical protein